MKQKDIFKKMIDDSTSTKERLFYSAVYLFSTEGYANVGIRKLCRSVDVKESAFYNHYKSKDELFKAILDYFIEISSQRTFTEEEINEIVKSGDIEYFLKESMKKFGSNSQSPLYYHILQIIMMESYTKRRAYELVSDNAYFKYTEMILGEMAKRRHIKECDVKTITSSYFYAIKGIMNQYLLLLVWDEDTAGIDELMDRHVHMFVEMLRNETFNLD